MTFLLNKALFKVNDNDTFKENDMINPKQLHFCTSITLAISSILLCDINAYNNMKLFIRDHSSG